MVLTLALASTSCGSPSASKVTADTEAATADEATISTLDIATLVYDTNYSVPENFYTDDRADTSRSYTMHHLLDETASFELCTDDYATAAAWEEADNASRAVQGYFVAAHENERYFEFARELSYQDDVGNIDDITSPGFARVLKCRYADRQGVDRIAFNGYAGHLKNEPLDANSMRVFAEYFWQFRFFPTSTQKVIASDSVQTAATIDQTLLIAFATVQGAGQCDQIEVAEWRFSANRSTGRVHKYFETITIFEARLEAGQVSLCS
ncbi:MAG: hypothetical protein AAF351_10310 [Pseudomonadota bacterium]